MNIQDKCNNYDEFCNIIKNESLSNNNEKNHVDSIINFLKNNIDYLKDNQNRNQDLGKNIILLSEKIRKVYPKEIETKNNEIRKLVKKIEVFGKTRQVSTQESQGYDINDKGFKIPRDKNILSHIFSFLDPNDRKNVSLVSKEWKKSKENIHILIKSINSNPHTPIKEYFKNFTDLNDFIKEYGQKLTSLNLKNCFLTNEQLKQLNIGKLKNLETLNLEFPPFGRKRILDVEHLVGIENLNLHTLNLSGNLISDELLLKITQLPLRSLNLSFCPHITIEKIKELQDLHTLILDECKIKDEDLGVIENFKNLKTLNLSGNKITNVGIGEIAKIENLEELNIYESKITDNGVQELIKLRNLKKLDLSKSDITDNGLSELTKLEYLEKLDLCLCEKITDNGLINFQNVDINIAGCWEVKTYHIFQLINSNPNEPIMNHLKDYESLMEFVKLYGDHIVNLNLDDCKLSSEQLKELKIGTLKNLKTLNLGYNLYSSRDRDQKLDDEILNGIENLNLHTLNLSGNLISDTVFLKLAKLPLRSLDLSSCPNITGKKIKTCQSLHTLILDDCKIDDLSGIENLKNLKTLRLQNIKMENFELKEILELKNLEVLDLSSSKITDDELLKLKNLKNLKNLDLHMCNEITNKGLEEVVKFDNLEKLDVRFCFGLVDDEIVSKKGHKKLEILHTF